MKQSKKILISVTIIFILLSSIFAYIRLHPVNHYTPKVLVIYKSGTNEYTDIYQNYKQSYILNTEVTSIDDNHIVNTSLNDFDIVYPDVSLLSSSNLDKIKPMLASYTANGGGLFLENEWKDTFPTDFTGVSSYITNNSNNPKFTYPKLSYNLEQFQLVVKSLLDNFTQYRNDDFSYLKFNLGILNGSQSLADTPQGSLLSINKYKNGYVLTSSSFLPNKDLITGFDMTAKTSDQKYFDYTLTTANYFVRNEFLGYILKEKDGYVLKKTFGPYGRPAMAWQNHYEALSPIGNKEIESWIDVLKDYNEIPSISLVRSSYDWGKWQADITVHLNIGTTDSPKFQGASADSCYSEGQRIEGENNHIIFGDYPKYKSLKDSIELPFRASPTVVDYNNDDKNDLIVGSPEGKLYLLKNIGTRNNPGFSDKQEIKLSNSAINNLKYAAPVAYDINKDGLFDLMIGNDKGQIQALINHGSVSSPTFSSIEPLADNAAMLIKVDSYASPTVGDIDGDGIDDLVIGSGSGAIAFYKGTKQGFVPDSSKQLTLSRLCQNPASTAPLSKGAENPQSAFSKDSAASSLIKGAKGIDKFSTPVIYDWNHDGRNDILVGDSSGMIKIFLSSGDSSGIFTTFTYAGTVDGQTNNANGGKSLLGGHNSVPVVTDWNADGRPDLLVGQLEFGIPINIDAKDFPYRKQLEDTIAYVKSFGISIYPHFLTQKYKSPEQENTELELHKKAFESYGLKWIGGVDQHTWAINNNDPQQTLRSEMASGIWWNFGFNPPNEPDLPRDGKEFMWSTPFLLGNGEKAENFLTFTPSPNLFVYPDAYKSFSALDMPITYFEHIEYAFTTQPQKLDQLKQMAAFLNDTRENGNYNFITQDQMAKSFINTFYSKAFVSQKDNEISIAQNLRSVPNQAGQYKGTLGIKLERGEKYKDAQISTTSPIHFEKDGALYLGLFGNTKINFSKPSKQDFYIVRSNVPIKTTGFNKKTVKITFLSDGMQQIKIYSTKDLDIQGERIKIQKNQNYYTITHYGKAIKIRVLKK